MHILKVLHHQTYRGGEERKKYLMIKSNHFCVKLDVKLFKIHFFFFLLVIWFNIRGKHNKVTYKIDLTKFKIFLICNSGFVAVSRHTDFAETWKGEFGIKATFLVTYPLLYFFTKVKFIVTLLFSIYTDICRVKFCLLISI